MNRLKCGLTTDGAETQVRLWRSGSLVTPTIDIEGEIITDFDRPCLEQILNIGE